ncbi:MAG: hypothetical protein CM1200mP15_23020 [Dehalococcoidia bacterium]|nr:MAG: hypothetical protein CM1200mP15_23020 [Dehalococcoidia bacterium]
MPVMTGGKFLADTFKGYGVSHVFFMPVIVQRALLKWKNSVSRELWLIAKKPQYIWLMGMLVLVTKREYVCPVSGSR